MPADPDQISSFLNIRVAEIKAYYELWGSQGAEFIAEPKVKYGEIRCYIRDPDGYIIEVGQSTDLRIELLRPPLGFRKGSKWGSYGP